VFNARHSDYVRTERTGHLDLIEALKGMVLNLRWNENLRFSDKIAPLGPNQMRIGSTFATPSTFRQGVIARPS